MNETLLKKIHEAREHLAIRWDESRARTLERELLQRAERDRRPRRPAVWVRVAYGLAALTIVAIVSGLAIRSLRSIHRTETARLGSGDKAARSLRLEDGTAIVLTSEDSSIRTLETAPQNVGIELVEGGAHFEVTRNPARIFRVVASAVTVEVVGTSFTVEKNASGVRVAVDEGRVKVRWGDNLRVLSAGEEGTFGTDDALTPAPGREVQARDGGVVMPSLGKGPRAVPEEWRSLARDGDFNKAYEALRNEGPGAVRDEPNELLLQADVARLSGHPDQAVAPLNRVLQAHPADAHAPLAAFTLGRVLLDELKRPREAAQAFARVYKLVPAGPLAQDALAREVEAWSRAGEAALAHDRGLRYVRQYPQGRKLNAVRHNAGLE